MFGTGLFMAIGGVGLMAYAQWVYDLFVQTRAHPFGKRTTFIFGAVFVVIGAAIAIYAKVANVP